MILNQIQLSKPIVHELNNEGCLCQMCQKLGHKERRKVVLQPFVDHESESYTQCQKQYYIKILHKMTDWSAKQRKLRFLLPQICVYNNSQPVELISKKHENHWIKSIKEKGKLHMFQIIQLFLEGFVFHNRDHHHNTSKKKPLSFAISNNSQKYRNECIVIAKYKDNFYELLTLSQMQGLFKSRQKHMRDGLMYVQTLVCTKNFNQIRININLFQLMKTQKFQRAKKQAKILHDQIKLTDLEYFDEAQQINFEKQLKKKNIRQYLQYLTLKIILSISKKQATTISEAIFKFAHSKDICYLIDVRVQKISPSEQFWTSDAMKMYEYKLSRRMSMMEMGNETKKQQQINMLTNREVRNLSVWLDKSTEIQWNEMKVIRNRLQRLQKQKRALMQSQSTGEVDMNKTFKVRKISRY